MFQSRCARARSPCKSCPGDSGPQGSFDLAGVGSLRPGDRRSRLLPNRALPANPAGANSSTMKGPQGLASEFCERRCQIANGHCRWVRGCFYVRSPEITFISGADAAGSGELCRRQWSLRVTPDSDVTRKAKDMANAGSPAAAGAVPGAWPGKPGDRNAVGWECGLSREPAGRPGDVPCRAVGARSFATGGAGQRRRKG